MRGKARLRHPPDMVQHPMDIHRRPVDRPVGEHFHPVDEVADTIRLILDKLGEFDIGFRGVLLEQLRRATNARKRVLDLMRQHRRHGGGAARGTEEIQLPVQHRRRAAIGERQHHRTGYFRQRRAMGRDAGAVQPRALQQQIMVGDRGILDAHLAQQGENPAILGQEIAERHAHQRGDGLLEKLLRRLIGKAEIIIGIQHHRGHGQGREHRCGVGQRGAIRDGASGEAGDARADHAASLSG